MAIASFNNIKNKIEKNINQSKENIVVAVAWLTSKDLLGQLTDKLIEGCKVEILISDHFQNQTLDYQKFIENGGQVFIVPTKRSKFLHDKFAIFDNAKLIAGSYNWTNSAEYYNHEYIIQSEDSQLIKQFSIRFSNLKKIVTDYDKQKLLSNDNLTAETKEEEFLKIEDELHQELINSVNKAVKDGAKINKEIILTQIYNYGAIGAANRLVKEGTEKLHSGLIKLFDINRLDLSIESIILKQKYHILFDKEILEKAQNRLDKFKSK
ncbi:phospholipase D-like domain-containing protein [Flagellimonas sp. GZD32]|uniref:phospholipase D-like domain-containing protein n=1 Tax=Flagellimonas cixiensis TaxID=3228750 RepID=UPI0035C93F18